jgi:hypothetical protein
MDLPFGGFTVTVTLQDPALSPRSLTPETLQTRACLAATLSDTFDFEGTTILAKPAIDLAVTDLDLVNFGMPTAVFFAPREIQAVLLPALSVIRILKLPNEVLLTEVALTPNPMSAAFTKTVVA